MAGSSCQEKDTWDARGKLELNGAREARAGGRQRKRSFTRGGQFATILKRQNFLAATTKRLDLNIHIVGAGALIPNKRGDDDVGWFISYSHS